MAQLSLLRRGDDLAHPSHQKKCLAEIASSPTFQERLSQSGVDCLQAEAITTLQINVGKVCNQTCSHCHVDAGPDRREAMSESTAEACLEALERGNIGTLDITGGAPEMNPQFRMLASRAAQAGKHVIDRCNLTILTAAGFEDLAEFLAQHSVEVVASLPCYLEENTDAQRGNGVFKKSIAGLRRLNELGYGKPDSGLKLTLVYNPIGNSLPPEQSQLEAAYRKELRARYGIEFNQLFTITNLPISRFLDELLTNNQLESYLEKLVQAFNPSTVDGLMCRHILSVDWQGYVYDCDFNQMLDIPSLADEGSTSDSSHPKTSGSQNETSAAKTHISAVDFAKFGKRQILTGRHCFGCTAGAGSSCSGALL